jgi:hypothetical protein
LIFAIGAIAPMVWHEGAMNREKIFNENGTLRNVYYCAASGTRGAILSINIKAKEKGAPKLTNSFVVDGVDFNAVYERVVSALADFYGIGKFNVMRDEMRESKAAFLKANGLTVRVVSYDQVTRGDK